eukprot:3461500-Rhodomonas_salina.1
MSLEFEVGLRHHPSLFRMANQLFLDSAKPLFACDIAVLDSELWVVRTQFTRCSQRTVMICPSAQPCFLQLLSPTTAFTPAHRRPMPRHSQRPCYAPRRFE